MNQKINISSPPVEYGLTLSDGSDWCLSGTGCQSEWMDRYAAIMELEESRLDSSPKLIFSSKKNVISTNTIKARNETIFLNLQGQGAGWTIDNPASFRVRSNKRVPDVICKNIHANNCEEIQFLNMWYGLFPIYQRGIYLGGLPFHAGLAELDGQGVLLAASSGAGKSTCCGRLPDYWQSLCDDETLVVMDTQKKFRAHPFPTWSEYLCNRSKKTWNVQNSVPLHGIFFLKQSETDGIESMNERQAVVLINESAAQIYEKFLIGMKNENQRYLRLLIFNNACDIVKKIPIYYLCVRRQGRFWEKIEKVLGSKKKDFFP